MAVDGDVATLFLCMHDILATCPASTPVDFPPLTQFNCDRYCITYKLYSYVLHVCRNAFTETVIA